METVTAILTLMAVFNHTEPPPEYMVRTASAISTVATTPSEARLLIAISWGETQFGVRGVPFGATEFARHHPGRHELIEYAQAAMRSMVRGANACHINPGSRPTWIFYLSGNCNVPQFIRVRVRVANRRHHRRFRYVRQPHPAQIYANEMMGRLRRLERAGS